MKRLGSNSWAQLTVLPQPPRVAGTMACAAAPDVCVLGGQKPASGGSHQILPTFLFDMQSLTGPELAKVAGWIGHQAQDTRIVLEL